MNNTKHARLFEEQGYFVVPAFLSLRSVDDLRRVCDLTLEKARGESEQQGHTTPSISLASNEEASLFFASPAICALLHELTGFSAAHMIPRIKKVDYYHEQTKRDWDGDWHRDSNGSDVIHVRVALEDDDRLEIVPGSHRRADTDEELRIRKGANRTFAGMPNRERITLRKGDACVFHACSIHRATYRRGGSEGACRRTLDALFAFGSAK